MASLWFFIKSWQILFHNLNFLPTMFNWQNSQISINILTWYVQIGGCLVMKACHVTPVWKATLEVEDLNASFVTIMTCAAVALRQEQVHPVTQQVIQCSVFWPEVTQSYILEVIPPQDKSGVQSCIILSLALFVQKWVSQKPPYRYGAKII